MQTKYKVLLNLLVVVLVAGLVGFFVMSIGDILTGSLNGEGFKLNWHLFIEWKTWAVGAVAAFFVVLIWLLSGSNLDSLLMEKSGSFLGSKKGKPDVVRGSLENSRFLTEKERDKYFPEHVYSALKDVKKDGIPVRAVLDKKNALQVNFLPGAHSLIIGATGSGKTTTFINPMIQLLGATAAGSSMIMTDPKGELFDLHSKFLVSRGYKVLLLDLRDTYSSSRWNPLEGIWDMYQEFVQAGKGIKFHKDNMSDYPDLFPLQDRDSMMKCMRI